MNDILNENSNDKLSRINELSNINQIIIFCSELLSKKLSTNPDAKIQEVLKILEKSSSRLSDYVVSIRDESD